MGLRKIIRKALYNLKYTKKKSNSVSGKNFLITGASSGIGLSLTKSLISKNKVIGVYNSNKSNLDNIRSIILFLLNVILEIIQILKI